MREDKRLAGLDLGLGEDGRVVEREVCFQMWSLNQEPQERECIHPPLFVRDGREKNRGKLKKVK